MRTFALILASSALLTACGPSKRACDPTTCFGCCDAQGTCQLGSSPTQCGANGAACSSCLLGQSCSAGQCTTLQQCQPRTCSGLGFNCGQAEDGCGGVLDCGTCTTSGESCGGAGTANVCGPGVCTPKTCTTLGYGCGGASDGCGALLDCGTCSSGFCGGGGPHQCGNCQPATCQSLGKNCGLVSDTCGGMVDCGQSCPGTQTCGGGGTPNVCGMGACTPKTCSQLGKNCDSVDDGCGNMISCGSCSGWLTCGGGGTGNVCGATCSTGCPSGYACSADGVCQNSGSANLVLDVKTVTLSGSVTMNGAAPEQNCYSAGDTVAMVELYETTHGYSLTLYGRCTGTGATTPVTFSGTVYPGTYRVSVIGYNGGYSQTNLPTDTAQVVVPALNVTSNVANQTLDVKTVTLSGSVTMNGGPPEQNCYSSGDTVAMVELYETTNGYSLTLYGRCTGTGAATPVTFSGTVYPGTYKVSVIGYNGGYSQTNLPTDTAQVVVPALTVTSNLANQVLDVKTVTLSGSVTMNGGPPEQNCYSSGDTVAMVELYETTNGYSLTLYGRCTGTGASTPVSFSGTVYPGTWRVSVIGYNGGYSQTNLPTDTAQVVVPALTVSSNLGNQVLDVKTVTLSGSVTMNGGPPEQNCYSSGDTVAMVELYETTNGYSLTLYGRCTGTGATTPVTFSGTVYPGTYKVSVIGYNGGYSQTNLPTDTAQVVLPALAVNGNVSGQTLDVKTVTLSGSVTMNGGPPEQNCYSSGDTVAMVELYETTNGYSLTLYGRCTGTGASTPVTFSGTVYPGTWRVSVVGYNGGYSQTNLPTDTSQVVVPALAVNGNVSGQVLDVKTVTLAGGVTMNGGPPEQNCYSSGDTVAMIELYEVANHYNLTLYGRCTGTGATTPVTFSGTVYPGTYAVSVIGYNGGYSQTNLPTDTAQVVIDRLQVP